jgi:hypothetical protein
MDDDTKKHTETAKREAIRAAPPRRVPRKLLAATVGLAFVSMVGAGCSSGNLVSPPRDAGTGTDTADDEDAPGDR